MTEKKIVQYHLKRRKQAINLWHKDIYILCMQPKHFAN